MKIRQILIYLRDNFSNLIFAVVGLGFICGMCGIKAFQMVTDRPRFKPFPGYENRERTAFPDFATLPLKQWGGAVDTWYNDNFAYRTDFVNIFRGVLFYNLKTPIGREVPGLNGWIYRKGDSWAELDDYVGAYELTTNELEKICRVFEGRTAYGWAVGTEIIHMPTPPKAQGRPEFIPYAIRAHRGINTAKQLQNYLKDSGSFAITNVIFLHSELDKAVADGRETFFDVDHHMNDYATYLMYDKINRFITTRWPESAGESPKYYGENPPKEVTDGTLSGCWKDDIRLGVSRPGDIQDNEKLFSFGKRFPYCNVHTYNGKHDGISVVMTHDSYMRFTLASWRQKQGDVRFPFCEGVNEVYSYIFGHLSDDFVDSVTTNDIPEIILEQFADFRMKDRISSLTLRTENAALYQRGSHFYNGDKDVFSLPEALSGDFVRLRFVFDELTPTNILAESYPTVSVLLKKNDEVIDSAKIMKGLIRPFFSNPVKAADIDPEDKFSVIAEDGSFSSIRVDAVFCNE